MLYHSLTPEEFAPKIHDQRVCIIDVREPSECLEGMIEKAINIPLGALPEYNINRATCDEVVFYCRSGHRSKIAAQIYLEKYRLLDLPAISHLKGGYISWVAWVNHRPSPIDQDAISE